MVEHRRKPLRHLGRLLRQLRDITPARVWRIDREKIVCACLSHLPSRPAPREQARCFFDHLLLTISSNLFSKQLVGPHMSLLSINLLLTFSAKKQVIPPPKIVLPI